MASICLKCNSDNLDSGGVMQLHLIQSDIASSQSLPLGQLLCPFSCSVSVSVSLSRSLADCCGNQCWPCWEPLTIYPLVLTTASWPTRNWANKSVNVTVHAGSTSALIRGGTWSLTVAGSPEQAGLRG